MKNSSSIGFLGCRARERRVRTFAGIINAQTIVGTDKASVPIPTCRRDAGARRPPPCVRGMLRRMSAVRMFLTHRPSSMPCRREGRADERQEQIVNLARRERVVAVDPPVQHENKRTDDVLREQVGRNG